MESKLRQEYTKGQIVILDYDRHNSSIVEVVSQTSGKLFTLVKGKNTNDSWSVMTVRLKEIENDEI